MSRCVYNNSSEPADCYKVVDSEEDEQSSTGDNDFSHKDAPFLLLTEDPEGEVSYHWWNNEENLRDDAIERKENGERIVCAIEILSGRDISLSDK